MTATVTTVVDFDGSDGSDPVGTLLIDSAGDILGVAGKIFEITKTASGYASTPTVLAPIGDNTPGGGLVADAAGNVFGTTVGGTIAGGPSYGTVFELAKTSSGYASQ